MTWWRFFRRATDGELEGLVVCNSVWKKCKKAFLSVFNLFALFGTRVLTSHWCTQLPKCILHHAKNHTSRLRLPACCGFRCTRCVVYAHGDAFWFPVLCWPSDRSRWQLLVTLAVPMPSSQLKAGFWFLALGIRLFGQSQVPKNISLELCCPYNSFFLISICFLLPLWFFQVILLAPIIDFSLVQAGRKYPEGMSGSWLLLLVFIRFAPVWPCFHFSSDKRETSCFFHRRALICIWKKHVWFYHFPKRHTVCYSSYPWRKTPEQWKLPLSRSWLIQSFSDPWLARNFVILWGQTLRLQKVPITMKKSMASNVRLQPVRYESGTTRHCQWVFFLENVHKMSWFLIKCLFLNFTKASQTLPLRRKTYVSSLILFGPLLTVLKSVLESAHHSSIFQSVPNCVFVPNPQKNKTPQFLHLSVHSPAFWKPLRTPTAGPQKELHLQPALKLPRSPVCAETLELYEQEMKDSKSTEKKHQTLKHLGDSTVFFWRMTFKAEELIRHMVRSNPSFLVLFCQLLRKMADKVSSCISNAAYHGKHVLLTAVWCVKNAGR